MSFINKLKEVKHATQNQKIKELWDVEGILNNQPFKFDLRPLKNNLKKGSFKTKADKMVFDIKNQYIIVDVEELHVFLKEKKISKVNLVDLLDSLDWNIVLNKV